MLSSTGIRTYGSALAVLLMVCPAWGATVIYVDAGASGAGDGTTWTDAYPSVQPAVDAAVAGDHVWVAAGRYVENITLKAEVALYGGFAGTEDPATFDLVDRDFAANETILDGNQAGRVVTVPFPATQDTRIDGLTITNGSAGVYCIGGPTIANNRILGNSREGGIVCFFEPPIIVNNVISGNNASSGGGIFCPYAAATIANNTITGNVAFSPTSPSTAGGGIYCGGAETLIVNTIVAFNSSGVHLLDASAVLSHNCVYGNAVSDYSGLADPTGTNGNISADPRLAGAGHKNWHLQPDSPCVDAGNNAQVFGDVDFDGQPRILPPGGTVDIGADESDGTVWPDQANVIVRVSPAGDDANDGSSWPLAKRTVQAAIDAASGPGGEVWVQAGTYPERIILQPFAHVYGGFAGAETERDARDWTAHDSVLDGQQQGSVATALLGHRVSTLDGFTITNGNGTLVETSRYGGGLYCDRGSPRIVNNTITANVASNGGGG